MNAATGRLRLQALRHRKRCPLRHPILDNQLANKFEFRRIVCHEDTTMIDSDSGNQHVVGPNPLSSRPGRRSADISLPRIVSVNTSKDSQNCLHTARFSSELRLRHAPKKSSDTVTTEMATSPGEVEASRFNTPPLRPRINSIDVSVSSR